MPEQVEQPNQAREELERIFPQWFVSAAENRDMSVGQAMKFSPKRWLFPDFSFSYDDQDFVMPLIINFDSLINDLLAHQPGAFHYPGSLYRFQTTGKTSRTNKSKTVCGMPLKSGFTS